MTCSGMGAVAVEAHGVRLGVRWSGVDGTSVPALLPPLSRPITAAGVGHRLELAACVDGYILRLPDGEQEHFLDLASAQHALENHLALLVCRETPDLVALHGGVVEWRGRAIIFPGGSMSGKSTLVAAFLRAGARYLSDELALLDAEGTVHPYPRPLTLLSPEGAGYARRRIELPRETVSLDPVPAGAVLLTHFERGAVWQGNEMTGAPALLALAKYAVAIRDAPERTLAALTTLVERSTVLQGARGEAAESVEMIGSYLQVYCSAATG